MSDRADRELLAELRRIRIELHDISRTLGKFIIADEPIDPDDDFETEDDLPFT